MMKINLTVVWKARVENDPLQLDITKTGVSFKLLPEDPPGPPVIIFPHQHRHPRHDRAEDAIIFKGQEPPQGDFNIFDQLLMVL